MPNKVLQNSVYSRTTLNFTPFSLLFLFGFCALLREIKSPTCSQTRSITLFYDTDSGQSTLLNGD